MLNFFLETFRLKKPNGKYFNTIIYGLFSEKFVVLICKKTMRYVMDIIGIFKPKTSTFFLINYTCSASGVCFETRTKRAVFEICDRCAGLIIALPSTLKLIFNHPDVNFVVDTNVFLNWNWRN